MELAWQAGARLDGWDEHFNLSRWQQAAKLCQLNLNDFLQAREIDEILPWEHLQTGIDRQFLEDELAKATEEIYTPDCRYHACQKCGLCDFKTLFPIVYNRSDKAVNKENSIPKTHGLTEQGENQNDKLIRSRAFQISGSLFTNRRYLSSRSSGDTAAYLSHPPPCFSYDQLQPGI